MNEGTRFDLAYETMPWHKVDAVIFDIGNVLIRFVPDDFIRQLFPGDAQKQADMLARVYRGPYWQEFDRGTMTYEQAAQLLVSRFGGEYGDYMHALEGWIELKTPLEEGWRAAQRCRRAGKQLYLLSNYPEKGYRYLREKFASHFGDLFDGGVISCHVHQIKPQREIYETLIAQCGFDPQRAMFIDDTLANVEAAMKMGIHGFHMHESGMMDRFFL